MRRVEIAWPITDAKNLTRILSECCELYLNDYQDSWLLNNDGVYELSADKKTKDNKASDEKAAYEKPLSAQQKLLKKYAQ